MEDFGAHSANLTSAEERRAGASGALRPGSFGPRLLVSAAGQVAGQALPRRDLLADLKRVDTVKKRKTVPKNLEGVVGVRVRRNV